MIQRSILLSFLTFFFPIGLDFEVPVYAPDFYEVRLSPDMTSLQIDTTLVALEDWHARTGMNYHATTSSQKCEYKDEQTEGCIYIEYTLSMNDTTAMCDGDANNPRCGCTHSIMIGSLGAVYSANILVYDFNDDIENHENMLHECGHAFSLRHEENSIMARQMNVSEYPDITERDVAQYRKYHPLEK